MIRLAAAFLKRDWSLNRMSPFVYSHTPEPESAYVNTRILVSRYRAKIDQAKEDMTIEEADSRIQMAQARINK